MAELAPLASLDACPNNLPFQATRLLGRERELQTVRGLVLREGVRLVTLTGPGGSGKTRLGLQAATELLDQFGDGAFFVELSPISAPGLVVSTIARTLGLRDAAGRPLLEVLVDFLRRRRLLLLLDNFEQILAAATTVADLLRACPGLSVLVTSRAALQIGGEHEFPVPPLSLPDSTQRLTPDRVSQYAAVALFIERAVAIRPDFTVTNVNAPAVAEICVRLDGLPLAIELAAARIRLLSPAAILSRLGHGLGLLTGGRRDLPARQQTLRNTIAWSYDLLDPAEQALCRRLGVFVAGFTLEAAEAVCAVKSTLGIDVLDGVGSLVDKSLLRPESADDEPRFGMLETIREYALERLEQSGDLAMLRRRHAEYFLTLAEQAEPHFLRADAGPWLNRLQAEHDNLRAALSWCLIDEGDSEVGVQIAAALSRFWQIRTHLSEGQRWLEMALASSDAAPVSSRPRALVGAGWLAYNRGDPKRAAALFKEAADLSRQLGDRHGVAVAAGDLGVIMEQQGEYEQAAALLAESLTLYRETGDLQGVAARLRGLGSVACAQGDFERATDLLEKSLALCRQLGATFSTSLALGALGLAALYQGDAERALKLFDEGLELFRQLEHTYGIAWSLHYLGRVELLRGADRRATALLLKSLDMRQRLQDKGGIAQCLEGLAAVGLTRRQTEQAVQLLGAAANLREAIDAPLSPAERVTFEQELATARSQLSADTFAAIWAEARAWPIDRAIERALELARAVTIDDADRASARSPERQAGDQPASGHRMDASRRSPLTPRECEVAALIARGLTNRQIAAELIITERTADTHVRNILGKLALTSRAQVAAWAVRQGLTQESTS